MSDISKAFDKVWQEGFIFKLKQNGISGELLHVLSDFLSNRKQRVVLNSQNSSWANAYAWVLQGSILGPLVFIICINGNLASNAKLFADDTSLFSVVHSVNTSAKELNDDLKNDDLLMIWLSNGKWVSIMIRANKPKKSFSVTSQRDRPTHL